MTPKCTEHRCTEEEWIQEHFTVIKDKDGNDTAYRCTYCAADLVVDISVDGTITLRNHFESCKKNPSNMGKGKPQVVGIKEGRAVGGVCDGKFTTWRYDEEAVKAAIVDLVVDKLHFNHAAKEGFNQLIQVSFPRFQLPSPFTFATDCMPLYDKEKIKLKAMLRKNCDRVCLTIVSSIFNQSLNYMCAIAHFVDDMWKLHRKILSFRSYKGKDIGDTMESCLKEWGLSNVNTIFVDDASSCDTASAYLKDKCTSWKTNVLGGKLIHIGYVSHMITLFVNDGLKLIEKSVVNIRRAVKYAKQSLSRRKLFKSCINCCGIRDKKGLVLDCPTKWTSTYMMISSALKYKEDFDRFRCEDSGFEKEMGGKNIPTDLNWKKAKLFLIFFEHLYNLTVHVSRSSGVTSNDAFHEISDTYIILGEWERSNDGESQKMAKALKRKYVKYWGNVSEMNMLYIPVVLDPRYKLSFVQFGLELMYGDRDIKVEGSLECMEVDKDGDIKDQARNKATGIDLADGVKRAMGFLFNEYKGKYSTQLSGKSSSSNTQSQGSNEMESKYTYRLMDEFKRRRISVLGEKSELDKYLTEDIVEASDTFDILRWWKVNSAKFPILARIARDVLAVPISNVDSETAFITGARILDSFRSSLSPNMIEAFICTQEWLKVKNHVMEKDGDFANKIESQDIPCWFKF